MARVMAGASSLSQRRAAALEEYREVCTFIRHDDQMAWTILGLAATVAFGLWAYALKDTAVWSYRALAAITCGIISIGVGRLMARRITANTQIRWQRAIELELGLRFEHLTAVSRQGHTLSAPGINRTLDIVAVSAVLVWFVYVVAFVVQRA